MPGKQFFHDQGFKALNITSVKNWDQGKLVLTYLTKYKQQSRCLQNILWRCLPQVFVGELLWWGHICWKRNKHTVFVILHRQKPRSLFYKDMIQIHCSVLLFPVPSAEIDSKRKRKVQQECVSLIAQLIAWFSDVRGRSRSLSLPHLGRLRIRLHN